MNTKDFFRTAPVAAFGACALFCANTTILAEKAQIPVPAPARMPASSRISPTLADVPYGSDPAQILDFYKADSNGPAPLVFHIHGGGWVAGSKRPVPDLAAYLKAGISVISIEYRFLQKAMAAGVQPPVSWPVHDAARALQFVRSKAAEWNIDKTKIAATGASAGACSSLWLAFHEDLADRSSADPVSRESTRLLTVAVLGAQTSLDPTQLKQWTPNSCYGGNAFGLFDPSDLKTRDTRFREFLEKRETLLPWIREYSPYELLTPDDPPVYLAYAYAPAFGQLQKDPTHTANFGIGLQEKCQKIGTVCILQYPGAAGVEFPSIAAYLIHSLKAAR